MTALLPQYATRRVDDDIEHLIDTIQHADALDLLARLPDASVDMVLCDLPYGVSQAFYDSVIPIELMWEHLKRVVKERSAIVLTATQPFSSVLTTSNLQMFKYEWIWRKRRKTNFLNAKKMPLCGHEVALVFGHKMPNYYPQMKPSDGHETGAKQNRESILYGGFSGYYYDIRNSYYPDTVVEFSHDGELSVTFAHKKDKLPTHPNQKPCELFEYLIKTYTQDSDIVLDMTSGSGTTAVAARKCGRRFICGDNHLPYVELARERLQRTDPYRATPLANGQTQLSLFEAAS